MNAQGKVRIHTVSQGETLYRISVQYNVPLEELYKLNPTAKNGISIGQQLRVPASKPSTDIPPKQESGQEQYHMVKEGETLYSIARLYGVSPDDLKRANNSLSNPDKLSVGMIIKIPPQEEGVTREIGSQPKGGTPQHGITGLRVYVVPPGATVYSLLQVTGWTEEQLYHYNPQVRNGLKAGASILIPDTRIPNNEAAGKTPAFPTEGGYTVVLALPFGKNSGQRFSQYYEGFLMALLEEKKSGKSIHLYVLDCDSEEFRNVTSSPNNFPKVDMIIGGVSETSIEALASLARAKEATYVVPFTSKDYTSLANKGTFIYQVNTPHRALYKEVARKYVSEYKGTYTLFVQFPGASDDKKMYASELQAELKRRGMPYGVTNREQIADPNAIKSFSERYKSVVLVPESGSITAANNILRPLSVATDSLGVNNVTVFGYPEWQTYGKHIVEDIQKVSGSFYTTFIVDTSRADYKRFEEEYKGWYGHSIGHTFPRYSILGYDTGKYFLKLLGNSASGKLSWNGVQSKFEFEASPETQKIKSNLGVFFVQYPSTGGVRRY